MAKIKIYTTTTCPYCKMEKQYLDSKGISYDSVFVDEDENEAKKMMEESHQLGVPFTVITQDDGSKVTILGFDRNKLNEVLGLTG
ncbi:glutaredoxin family protein [Candidatus Daviesbacteria bacterium]|nr:glutaredoxin family protein [Candidatus Daviesbacteria bacterium]